MTATAKARSFFDFNRKCDGMIFPVHNFRLRDRRNGLFAIALLLTVFIAWRPLAALLDAAIAREQNSHILLVFPAVIGLLFLEARGQNIKPKSAVLSGFLVLAVALLVAAAEMCYAAALGPGNALSLSIAALVLAWLGLIIGFYGPKVFRNFAFPFLFLLLLIPLPPALLDGVTYALQYGSTHATHALFVLAGIPVARDGFVLSLPTIDIEVAAECSGIRSSMILFLTTLVLGHLFLRTAWRQWVLFLSVAAITILKNGVRIFTLSMLAIYVDPSWIEGEFHHRYGGSVFFVLAIGLLLLVLRNLRRSEQKRELLAPATTMPASANPV